MPFRKYKFIDDVALAYQLSVRRGGFLRDYTQVEMSAFLRDELDYTLSNIPYRASEAAIRENIIYPILRDIFKKYDNSLMLWANKSISFDKELGGIPDYVLAKQSHLGKIVFGKPLMAVVEAKKDDFEGGWAQCLLEMYTIQKINGKNNVPVYGIVSNGDNWEFGKLEEDTFTANEKYFTTLNKDELFSVLLHFFELCKQSANQF